MGERLGTRALGLALLTASIYLYLLYQQLESLPVGLSSVSLFALGFYLGIRDIKPLDPFRRILPFLVAGAAASLALVTFGLGTYVANSYYGTALAFTSTRLTAFLLALGGVKVQVSSDVLLFPNGRALSVGPLCSGAYSTILFLLLSVVMVADLGKEAPRKRLGIALALGVLGANLANVFRIAFLASMMYLFGIDTLEVVHQFAGYVIFLAFMSAFWLLSLKWLAPVHRLPE